MKLACLIFVAFALSHCFAEEEETGCSKYDFQEKVLKKLIRLEFDQERLKSEVDESLKKTETLHGKLKRSMNEFERIISESIKSVDGNVTEIFALFQDRFSTLEQRMLHTLDGQQKKLGDNTTDGQPMATVAFMSRNPHKSKPHRGETIIFETTLINNGGGYDGTTGVFTAPVDGVYLFSTQLCIEGYGRYIFSRIMHNGTPLQASLIHDTDSNFCSSSNTVVVLKESERVWVECGRTSDARSSVLDENDENWNTFSGVLINGFQ